MQGLEQRAAQVQAEGHDDGAGQQCHPPAPGVERRTVEKIGEQHAHQAGDHHGEIGAGRLQRNVEATAVRRRGFHEKGGVGSHLATEREALQQPKCDDQQWRGEADRRVARNQRHADHRDAHQPERKQHGGLATRAICIPANDQCPQWPRQEPRTKGGQRGEQTGARCVRGEERPSDLHRKKRVGDEVIELDGVADDDRDDLPGRQMSGRCVHPHPVLPELSSRAPNT